MRVLIVEDSPAYGQLQTLRLLNSPTTRFDSHQVYSLEEALDYLDNQKVDVALVDLGLPDAHGAAAVRAIHLAHPDLPIVVMTGTLDDDIHDAAKLSGATDVTRKGADSDETMELRLLAAAYRKAYARISEADPIAPVTRALVADITLHLRTGETILQSIRDTLATDEPLDRRYLDESLGRVQEALAPMKVDTHEDLLLGPVDLDAALRRAADHTVGLSLETPMPVIIGQQKSIERALASLFSTMYDTPGPIKISAQTADHTVSLHITHGGAQAMKREHPLLWTMSGELLSLSLATIDADASGFTLRFAAATGLDHATG